MTLAEYFAWVKGWSWRDKQEWLKVAQLGCFILAPWSKTTMTPERLMGAKFFAEIVAKKFKTEEEWKKHKEELRNMSRYFERVYKELKSGERKPTKVMDFGEKKPIRSK